MTALTRRIYPIRVKCEYGENWFVPNDVCQSLFTEEELQQIRNNCRDINVDRLTKVIATILFDGEPDTRVLQSLHTANFTDQDLPVRFDLEELALKSLKGDRGFSASFECAYKFVETQWLFCAPSFGPGIEHQELEARCPLPIIECHPPKTGAFGEVRQVKLHHAHLVLTPQGASPIQVPSFPDASVPADEDNPDLALKKLTSDAPKDYERERNALEKIQRLNHPHLINVIASFRRGQDYFFLFPWASRGDLESWWRSDAKEEQRTPEMIRWILGQMKGIISAIKTLHYPRGMEAENENGRHGDLKPKNILLFDDHLENNPRGRLIISDAGLAKFHNQVTSRRVAGTSTMGGTQEYGPPDLRRGKGDGYKLSRRYDMWSLGCVFLEFIVWVLGGYDEVEKFRNSRKSSESRSGEFYWKTRSRYKVQREVKQWMKAISRDKRCRRRNWFQDLLKIIEKDLLQVNNDQRITSKDLEIRFNKIVENAQDSDSYVCGPDAERGFHPQSIVRESSRTKQLLNPLLAKKRWPAWLAKRRSVVKKRWLAKKRR
ncbi:kinase-like domain-containing protein [Xylaria telfairii]|nr:kinase-like domain-containing protein [Xylaria telfairii]